VIKEEINAINAFQQSNTKETNGAVVTTSHKGGYSMAKAVEK
jgi:hypothetical protein